MRAAGPVVEPGDEAPVAAASGIYDGDRASRSSRSSAAARCCSLVVFELVRRRRLLERYALLWLFSSLVLLGLAVWRGLLDDLARAIGISYPPNALFVVAFGFVLVLLLHFSLAVSRLADQTKVLAQRARAARGARAPARAGRRAGRRRHGARPDRVRSTESAAREPSPLG